MDTRQKPQSADIRCNANWCKCCCASEEQFVAFIDDHDTRAGLYDTFIKHLEKLTLNIPELCGQPYDNESNMQGTHQGAQKRALLDLAFSDASKSWKVRRPFWIFPNKQPLQQFAKVGDYTETCKVDNQESVYNLMRMQCYSIEVLHASIFGSARALEKEDAETVPISRGMLKEMKT